MTQWAHTEPLMISRVPFNQTKKYIFYNLLMHTVHLQFAQKVLFNTLFQITHCKIKKMES